MSQKTERPKMIVSIVERMTEPEQKFVLETLIHYQEVRNSLTKDSIT